MKSVLIGQEVTRFFCGNKYVFKRIRRGEWEMISPKHGIAPMIIVNELGD